MTTNKTIFVTGGTGKQGGAVARNLVQQGFTVKVLTRKTNSTQAENLKKLNIELVEGDLNNADTYRQHLKGVYGIFSVQSFENGVKKEISQGVTLATLGKEFEVKHFLYSSACEVDHNTGVPHMDSKFEIENHIKQTGLPFTIIRPTSFYENFLIPQVKKGILKGKLVQPINRDTIIQYIATEDIGKAAAKIFENSEEYLGRTIPLAAEHLSTQEVAKAFTKVMNKKIEYKKLPVLITRVFMGNGLYKMFKYMDEKSVFPIKDVESTKKEFTNLVSLENWIGMNFRG
ncbi:NmrA/HSCARG family protein [Daejeonella sp.]|uniref:NmrA/HSCARG family protein n=1 Tax=Daejeonella sp. TaxID=2805397 RepID=UPI0030BF5E04